MLQLRYLNAVNFEVAATQISYLICGHHYFMTYLTIMTYLLIVDWNLGNNKKTYPYHSPRPHHCLLTVLNSHKLGLYHV